MAEFDGQIERVHSKLTRVRELKLASFGAASHGYALGPPLSEAEVREFEDARGIRLPPAYRAFVTQVGHGGLGKSDGAGPYYGLYKLERWDDFMDWAYDGAPDDWLARSCPLRPGRNDLPEIDEDQPDDEWPGAEHLANFAGILSIGSRGCTYLTGLVVTGAARGRVVYLDVQYCEQPYVGRDANFLDWYERWLDELLGEYSGSWFGYGPAGDERQLCDLYASTRDDELRGEAVSNLWKLPELTETAWLTLTRAIRDETPEVRARAAEVFDRGLPAHAPALEPLLSDSEPRVRAAASRSIVHLSPAYVDAVWSLLMSERDEAVQHAAYHALEREDALSVERLEAVAESEHLGPLRTQAQRALARQ